MTAEIMGWSTSTLEEERVTDGRTKRFTGEYAEVDMSWEMVKLGNICTIKTGKYDVNHSVADGKYPFFTCAFEPFKSNTYSFDGELILLPGNGANVGEVLYYSGKAEAYQRTYVLHDFKDNTRFVYYFFRYCWKRTLTNQQYGSATNYIRLNNITNLQIPLPPLSTQKRIAEILDKADALRKKDQQLLKHYDQLAQSLFIELFGDPVKNEKGWEVKKLGELGNWKSGGTPTRSNPEFFKGNIPWLSSGELNNMFISESIESITEEAIQNSSTSLIPINSLLLGMYDTAALKSSINKVVLSCNQAIAFSQLNKKISNVIFVYYLIRIGKEEFKKAQRGVRQKNLNLSLIKDIRTIHPPISLQNQFATQIQNIEQQKERLKLQVQASEHLFQSLLKQAFNGGLN